MSEAGINSRSYSEESFKEQSAGFAYAWKKLNGLEGIDGLQWHNWFDNEGDGGGILLGLRKFIDKIMVSPNLYGSSTVKLALQPKMKHLLHLWMSSVFQTGILLIRFNQPN